MLPFLFPLIQLLLLFVRINNKDGRNDTKILKGFFRIDSLYNNYSLTNKKKEGLIFVQKKNIAGQKFQFVKNNNNKYYYIKVKGKSNILKSTKNGDIICGDLNDGKIKKSMEWDLIEINDNQYVIKNHKNNNFLEINNNTLQCKNKLSLPNINKKFIFSFLKFYEEVEISKEDLEIIEKEPIDVLIKYIDLSDKTLNRTGIRQIKKDEDNEELRYSVRSILKYIPWIRKIYILMPNEKVKYFKPYEEIKEKIVYVKDKDVLGFDSANIYAFTFNLFRLKKFGLTENFIYMDDDFFIGQNMKKSDFFYYEKKEKRVVPSLSNTIFDVLYKGKTLAYYKYFYSIKDKLKFQGFYQYYLSILCTEKFFLDNYKNITIISPAMTHNAIAYNIKDLEEIYQVVVNNYKYANETLNSKERFVLTLQTQHFVDLYQLNIKHKKVHPISSILIPLEYLKKYYLYTPLFGINTGGDINYTQGNYTNLKKIMKERFPDKTPYEIDEENNNTKIGHIPNKTNNSNHNISRKNNTNNNYTKNNDIYNNNINNNDTKNNDTYNNDTKYNDINNNTNSNSKNNYINNNTNNESKKFSNLLENKIVNNTSNRSIIINNLNNSTINFQEKKDNMSKNNEILEITIILYVLEIFLVSIILKVIIKLYFHFNKRNKIILYKN